MSTTASLRRLHWSAPPAESIVAGSPTNSTFLINDGSQSLTFEFVVGGEIPTAGDVGIVIHAGDSAATVATEIANAINLAVSAKGFKVRAGTNPNGIRVDLFNAVNVVVPTNSPVQELVFNGIGDTLNTGNVAQGETLIEETSISYSRQVGILVSRPSVRSSTRRLRSRSSSRST